MACRFDGFGLDWCYTYGFAICCVVLTDCLVLDWFAFGGCLCLIGFECLLVIVVAF